MKWTPPTSHTLYRCPKSERPKSSRLHPSSYSRPTYTGSRERVTRGPESHVKEGKSKFTSQESEQGSPNRPHTDEDEGSNYEIENPKGIEVCKHLSGNLLCERNLIRFTVKRKVFLVKGKRLNN